MEQTLEELEVKITAFVYKNAEISKQYNEAVRNTKSLQEEVKNLKVEIKD
jgi:uncharacterized protein YeeX (DUF496 family)